MKTNGFTFRTPSLFSPAGLMNAWHGTMGEAFRGAVADEANTLVEAAIDTHNARSPLLCDASVLPYHARDRGIRRYTAESELSWRTRQAKHYQIKRTAGTIYCILRQLRIMLLPYGRPTLKHVVSAGDASIAQWTTLAPGNGTNDYFETQGLDPEFSVAYATPSNWRWDTHDEKWSRFSIIIAMDGITNPDVTAGEWDGLSEWDGVNVWDGGLSNPVVQDIVALCNEWKTVHSRLLSVLFVPNANTLDSTGTAATVAPWGFTTYPQQNWNDLAKRNPEVIFAFVDDT